MWEDIRTWIKGQEGFVLPEIAVEMPICP